MAIKEENSVVGLVYELKESGSSEILDSNKEGKLLEFVTGKGQLIPGLEKQLVGMKEGDEKTITVVAAEAYGERDDSAIQELPKEQFEGLDLEEGMSLYGQGENGEQIEIIVLSFNDNTVKVDFNHPLAGKNLEFDVRIATQRDATEEEAATGQVGGGGCSDGSCGCSH